MSGLEILEVPVPEIKDPDQMLIKMHVATFATGDAIVITGQAKLMMSKKPKYVDGLPSYLPAQLLAHASVLSGVNSEHS